MDIKTKAEIREKFKHATKRLVLLDYDGTLVNYTSLPEKAKLPSDITKILIKLIQIPQTKIFIITGRGSADIDRFLDHIPINIIAEHGAIMKEEGFWKNQIYFNDSWKEKIIPIMNQITTGCPNSFIEEKRFSIAWHYRNAEPELGYLQSRELIHLLKKVNNSFGLKILDGNKVVEILSNGTGKGSAVKKLFAAGKFDFVLSIGDDATDEEMFEYFLPYSKAVTIKVGEGRTHAKFKLHSINEVESLLNQLSA